MLCKFKAIRLLSLWLFPLALTSAAAKEYSSTPSIDLTILKDQYGNKFTLDRPQQTILFAADMNSKDIMLEALEAIDTTCLNNGEVIYLANISGMPKMIAKLFALPKMRKHPYSVWLDRDGNVSKNLPVKNNAVALIQTNNQKIASSEIFETSLALTNRLKTKCGEAE